MPISTDFLSGLYNRHSCYADRLSTEQLDAIHVSTTMEESLRKWIKAKKDLVITGNPGDGKTFLLRRLAKEIEKVQGVQILDATAEKDYESIIRRWVQARKAGRPFFLAINHGPLNRLLHEHAEGNPTLQEVRRQLDHSVYYGEVVPKAPAGVVVIDLNLRSVLTPAIIAGALDNILREDHYQDSPYFADATTDGNRNRHALMNGRVRDRLIELLCAAGYTTRHISMRDLQGFLSYLVFSGATTAELETRRLEDFEIRYFNLCYSGEGELFKAIADIFDPVRTTMPAIDEHLWENTGIYDGWVFSRPPLTPDHFPDAWKLFKTIKRQYFFEHLDGGRLLEYTNEDERAFQKLLTSEGELDAQHLGTILQAINRFYCHGLTEDMTGLRLWGAQEYDTHSPPVLVSCYRVEKQKFSLRLPQLAPWLRNAIDFKASHVLLQYGATSGKVGLKIDRGLWAALMLARRGIPMTLRSPQYSQLLQSFMTRLHKFEASPQELQSALIYNVARNRINEITVDRAKGRYISQ